MLVCKCNHLVCLVNLDIIVYAPNTFVPKYIFNKLFIIKFMIVYLFLKYLLYMYGDVDLKLRAQLTY